MELKQAGIKKTTNGTVIDEQFANVMKVHNWIYIVEFCHLSCLPESRMRWTDKLW